MDNYEILNEVENHKHQLHRIIGIIFTNYFESKNDFNLILDEACDKVPNQRIPLFCEINNHRATEFTNVDMLVTKHSKIHLICEIEESNIKPNHIFGKYLSIAMSEYWKSTKIDDKIIFLQILDTKRLKIDKTKKIEQWTNIEKVIKDKIICNNFFNIKNYKIIYGNLDNVEDLKKKIIEFLDNNL